VQQHLTAQQQLIQQHGQDRLDAVTASSIGAASVDMCKTCLPLPPAGTYHP
jgi:hypothetical protein